MMAEDKQIQLQVFTEYKARIFGYISRKNVPLSDREDVFGEILLKTARQAGRYDSARASVSTWVFNITRSVVADYWKKHRGEAAILSMSAVLPSVLAVQSNSDYVIKARRQYQLHEELPQMYQKL